MSTLFSNNAEGGYRLRYLEVFNWGTFHGKVFKLQPDGRTSLLTGANASGKTTLIDALLTLLVPNNKRFYNQSSGADSKKDRDENSYFWGYYGKTFSDSDERTNTEQLRNKADNPYSILLACFQNTGTQHTISLVQVRWFSAGTLKKVFIVAPYALNITEHFGEGKFDMKGEWKKKLVRQFSKVDIYDSFKEYASRFSDLFGLKENASSLFNQTVGIKVLGDLSVFIREHMLDEPNAEEQFINLHNHYTDLLVSHKAIQKDEKQLELLEPVVNNKLALEEINLDIELLNLIQEQLPYFFNKKEYELLDAHISDLEKKISFSENEKMTLSSQIKQLEQEQNELITQKALLNIEAQISLLNKEIVYESERRDTKKGAYNDYNKLAKNLTLQPEPDEAIFKENLDKANKLKKRFSAEYDDMMEKKTTYKIKRDAIVQNIQEIQDEITSLQGRKNRIPRELITVRQRLAELLEIGEEELPFAGELIKVLPDSNHWEDAIERILHGFAMQLLVPEKYNRNVNEFVHSNNLKARLVYQRINSRQADTLMRWTADDDSIINKIELKEAGIFTKWLEQQLAERFNYYCTDDLEVFYGSSKAVTSNGLIRNTTRHEKNDLPNDWNKFKYRLGWDNREMIRLLMEEKNDLQKQANDLGRELEELLPQIKVMEEKTLFITLITDKDSFDEIDWKRHAEKIADLEGRIQAIIQSSDQYKTICDQLDSTEQALKKKRQDKEDTAVLIESYNNDYNIKNKKKIEIEFDKLTERGLSCIENFAMEQSVMNIDPENLNDLEKLKKQINNLHRLKLKAASELLKEKQFKAIGFINAFVHPETSIVKEFPDWEGDVINIEPALGSLFELEDLYKKIRNQRLVEHKRRFKDYMDKSMLDSLTNYRTWLYSEEERIKEVIEELNIPLKKITFNTNPDTFLQLESRMNRAQEIKIFKEKLAAAIPNAIEFATQTDDGYRQEIFFKIRDLITELQKEDVWRRKVTDVRNWLSFNAREYGVVDNKPGQYHEDTSSYSGGQKAQFTYAILGAAIAHQFGIFQQGKQYKSLRFITVDEAFSKLDPEKSEFLMKFCDQLNLQILVVTPLDKINIAERYIHAVHFVEIKNKKHSIVYNLTMEQYYSKKEEFKQLSENSE